MDTVEKRILAKFCRIFLSLAESLRKSHSEKNVIKICRLNFRECQCHHNLENIITVFLHLIADNDHSDCTKAHMLFSARTSDELLFKSKFDEIANKKPDVFSVDYMRTQENNDDRVTKKKLSSTLDEIFSSKEKVFCYLCGPPQMVKDLTKDLESLGIPKCNIKYELWW